jgi:hypothetical protein
MRRTCANCKSSEWPAYRYCDDCWLMVLKTIAIEAATVVGAGVGTWIVRHWLL